jgi:hypothetical protein
MRDDAPVNLTAPVAQAAPAPCPARERVACRAAVPRRVLVVAAIAIVTAGAAPARAGAPVTDGHNLMRVEAAITPARAGGIRHPRAVALRLSASYRAVSSGAGEPFYSQVITTPNIVVLKRGATIPQCRFSAFGLRGPRACPKGSRVGFGSVVLDGRSASLPEELRVQLRLYNGVEDVNLPPGIRPFPVIIAALRGGPVKGHLVVDLPFLRCCTHLLVRSVDVSPPVLPTDLALQIRRIVGRGGRPYLVAPTTCRGSWRFTFRTRFERASTRSLTAVDDVPCRRA